MKIIIDINLILKPSSDKFLLIKTGKKLIDKIKILDKNREVCIFIGSLDIKKVAFYLKEFEVKFDKLENILADTQFLYVSNNSFQIRQGDERWLASKILGVSTKYFKAGDIVELRSGSLPMTIRHINYETNMANVSWFDLNGEPYNSDFTLHSLKHSKKDWHVMMEDQANINNKDDEDD